MEARTGAGLVENTTTILPYGPRRHGDAGKRACRRGLAGFALTLLASILTIAPAPAGAKPVNVNFHFTPYLPAAGDADQVITLEGVVELELNGVPMLEVPLKSESALVMERGDTGPEVSSVFWLDALALQPLVRRGDNLLRLRFTPKDGTLPYRSQFRWVVVEDQTTTSTTAKGSLLTTNHGADGREDHEAPGPATVQQAFQAPFARVEPWHDAPAVTALAPDDRAAILELIRRRAALFAPDFAAAYRHLASLPRDRGLTLDVPEVRRLACLEAGYAAGMRVAAPAEADLQLVTTGSPVVVARGAGEFLFRFPSEPGMAERYEAIPNDKGFCLAISFNMLFPKRLFLVKGVDGQWQILP